MTHLWDYLVEILSDPASAEQLRACSCCGLEKPITVFPMKQRKNGTRAPSRQCRPCINEKLRRYNQTAKGKMAKKAAQAKYAATHKEAIKAKGVRYQPIANQRARERRRTDPQFKISGNLRKRIGAALSGRTKGAHTEKLTGCSYDYLLKWLEYQFTDGMTFENYGVAWEIDHVKPCTSFDLTDVKQQFECFNWKNLRPLDPSTNRSKNNQVIEEEIAAHNIVVESWLNLQN